MKKLLVRALCISPGVDLVTVFHVDMMVHIGGSQCSLGKFRFLTPKKTNCFLHANHVLIIIIYIPATRICMVGFCRKGVKFYRKLSLNLIMCVS